MRPLLGKPCVNDADKGVPRTPPRNKMTFYEQLSTVSSQMFNPGPASSSAPLPPHIGNGSTMGPSPSSAQDCRNERTGFSPFHMPIHTPAHLVENNEINLNAAAIQSDRVPMMHVNRSSDAAAECSSARQHDSSSGQKFFGDKFGGDETSHSEQRQEETLTIKEQNKSELILDARENLTGLSPERKLYKTIDLNKDLHMGDEEQYQTSCGDGASVQIKCLNDNGSRNASEAKDESNMKILLDNSCQSENRANDHNQEENDKASGERNEACDAPMVDSSSRRKVHPDDIVESIGPKHFWKARNAIVNQQRVFAVQVFELHRLIKVQKLIAASPNMLLGGNQCLIKSVKKVSSENIPQPQSISKTQAETARQKDDPQKLNRSKEVPLRHPSRDDGLHKGVNVQHPQASTNVPRAQKPGVWCFTPPGNQWFVPVMTPSEGLVYKPCSAPFLPNAGFMPPIYQGCGPLNTTYGIPVPHQPPLIGVPPGALPFSANYHPAIYPMPVMNKATTTSAAKQVSLMHGSLPTGQTKQSSCNVSKPKSVTFKFQGSKEGIAVNNLHDKGKFQETKAATAAGDSCEKGGQAKQSSCNVSNRKHAAFLDRLSKFQASKEASAANNPHEKRQTTVQAPIQPAESQDYKNQTQTQVIKPVPQNARSTPELAVKIQSIQE